MDVQWIAALLGPGGLLALILVSDRVIRNWKAGKREEVETAIEQWRELLEERDRAAKVLRRQIYNSMNEADYWRMRAGKAEYLLVLNNIPLPAVPAPPKQIA